MSTINKELLIAEMDRQGVTDPETRAGIGALVGGESGFNPRTETPYTRTDNERIRSTFKTAFAGKSDAFISEKKRDPETFFNYVYGPAGAGRQLGNIDPGDGFKFRGRGGIQLTGRGNYTELARRTGLDLVTNPDLVNDPANSARVAVAYMVWRYKGGGWDAMKRAVGNSFGNVDDEKNALFEEYLDSGEFDTATTTAPVTMPAQPPRLEPSVNVSSPPEPDPFAADIQALQEKLNAAGAHPALRIDGHLGPRTLAAYQTAKLARR